TKVFLGVNGVVYLGLAIFAPLIIWLIFSEKYMNVIPVFQVLSLNFLVYSIRHLLGNVIAVIKRVKVNLVISIVSGILNMTLNLILIPKLGPIGAAAATVIVTSMTLIMEVYYLRRYLKDAEA
ncbi:MAG: polysaccharide biosynthesis C-terminal domain-containing protein, partial [Christensenellaceae bacterium]